MDLRNKTVVVTGASSGIGAATAVELSKAGARLVLTARRTDRLEEVAASLPGEYALLTADIGDPATPQALLDLALARGGAAAPLRSSLVPQETRRRRSPGHGAKRLPWRLLEHRI